MMGDRDRRGRRPRTGRGREDTPDSARSGDRGTPDPSERLDPGPRPISDRQRAQRERWRAAALEPEEIEVRQSALRVEQARSDKRRKNRKRRNFARMAMRLAIGILTIEVLAVLLFSPALWARKVRVEGNKTVTAQRIVDRMQLKPKTTIARMPTGKMRQRVLREPAIARADIYRRLPGTLIVRVVERKPWVGVKRNDIVYTADRSLVPFRKRRLPEADLPLIVLEGERPGEVKLGKRMFDSSLADATKCLLWAQKHENDFPLEKVRVDPDGKLCLNRKGGSEVQFGSGIDLDKKLNALTLLLRERPELRAGDFAYINLLAYDAPAVLPLSPAESPDAGDPEAEEAALPEP